MRGLLVASAMLLTLATLLLAGLDTDGDGVPDARDCRPLDGTIWAVPGAPVDDLVLMRDGTDAILEWSRPADLGGIIGSESYDVFGTAEPASFGHPTGFCVELEGADLTATDDRAFDLGPVAYYLVRVQNRCGSAPPITDPPPSVPRELCYLRVSNTNDSGVGSLSQAIDLAQDGDAVCLDVTGTLTLTSGLGIPENIAVAGPGSEKLTLTPGGPLEGILIGLGAEASLSSVTLLGLGGGKGIITNQSATIRSTTITSFLGGVDVSGSSGSATIINTEIIGNGNGRGVDVGCCGGEATIVNSTISGFFNGVYAIYGSVTVISSTIANNIIGLYVYYDNDLVITSSTIANNNIGLYAEYYGNEIVISSSTISGNFHGIRFSSLYKDNTATLDNTILSNVYSDCNSSANNFVYSGGHNISSDATCTELTQPSDQQNTDPLLGPLADNGGPTPTMALLPGSPAIDAGSCPMRTRDQRGMPRPVDDPGAPNVTDACDVGAYEKQ